MVSGKRWGSIPAGATTSFYSENYVNRSGAALFLNAQISMSWEHVRASALPYVIYDGLLHRWEFEGVNHYQLPLTAYNMGLQDLYQPVFITR